MRYLAQLSMNGPKIQSSYWDQLDATVQWLSRTAVNPGHPEIRIQSRSIVPLHHWSECYRPPVRLSGWLEPMEVILAWRYLHTFVGSDAVQTMWVPCGGDSYISWMPPHRLEIVAPSQSWIWRRVTNTWDPASWPVNDELEWWKDGRPQQARHFGWGFLLEKTPRVGWLEWVLVAESVGHGYLQQLWEGLAMQLGARPARIVWDSIHLPNTDAVAGISCRLDSVSTRIQVDGRFSPLDRKPLRGLRLESRWHMPDWNAAWGANMELIRWRNGVRLSAIFTPHWRSDYDPAFEQMLRQERRQLPILEMTGLPSIRSNPESWSEAQDVADAFSAAETIARLCRQQRWTQGTDRRTRRLPPGWVFSRLLSRPGSWRLMYCHADLRIEWDWPRANHPGNLTLDVGGVAKVGLETLDPSGAVQRWRSDLYYWVGLVRTLAHGVETWSHLDPAHQFRNGQRSRILK